MKQQIESWLNRSGNGNSNGNRMGDSPASGWFRIGVLSAAVVAPLIARWNEIRTSEQAQKLRDAASAQLETARNVASSRLDDAREQAVARLAPVRAAANTRLDNARELTNARLGDVRDRMLDRLAQTPTPDALRNVPPFSLATRRAQQLAEAAAKQQRRRQRQVTALWVAGVGVGLVAAGATAFVIARRRMAQRVEEEEPMVELPSIRSRSGAGYGQTPGIRNSYTAERAEMSVSDIEQFTNQHASTVPVQTATIPDSQAAYIGNSHTGVYHAASDTTHLPSAENRIYFSSEEEALAAGFRPAGEPSQSDGND